MKTQVYPMWEELPEIDLYLDQVLLYINQFNGATVSSNDKGLTAAMINNYVKHGHISKPVKKKYSRRQLARLIVITAFKNVFSIQEISIALSCLTESQSPEKLYNAFASYMNDDRQENLPPVAAAACQTLKLYQQTQQLFFDLKENDSNACRNET